jgi:5-formyltetrahydrofolate cyclo-ligase
MHAEKSRLRNLALKRRRRLKIALQKRMSRRIRDHILALQLSGPVLMFSPLKGEPVLTPLFGAMNVCLPRIAGKDLLIARFLPGQTIRHRFGMDMPNQHCEIVPREHIKTVLVPALLVDRNGNRLGFGGGYYDRFLAENPHCERIATVFSWQVVPRLPSESHDQQMDFILTEQGLSACNWHRSDIKAGSKGRVYDVSAMSAGAPG